MNYEETIHYLFNKLPMYQREGGSAFKKSLHNIEALLDRLGNPQVLYPTIHIAGTNGKGTVSHIIAAGIQNNDKKVGVYTSPHYKDFRERIKINGELMSEEDVIKFVALIQDDIEQLRPSFFEITVAMAFYYFAQQKVDIAVIETGLGGRLDSTNVIMPILSVITNISLDHQSMLGETLREIAHEKAGIIKYSVPVVIGEYQPEVQDVFDRKALSSNSAIFIANRGGYLKQVPDGSYQFYDDMHLIYDGIKIRHPHEVMMRNMVTALYSLSHIEKSIFLSHDRTIEGVNRFEELTYYIGRYQTLQENPKVIVDGAHNVAGIQLLMPEVQKNLNGNLHVVIGMVSDKDHDKVLKYLPKKAKYYVAKANIPRGMDASQLCDKLKEYDLQAMDYATVQAAYAEALSNADPEDTVLVSGSIFVVAEVL